MSENGNDLFSDAEVISRYTRAQAIEDGVLVDVSEMAREAGIRFPVAVTRRLRDEVVTPDERARPWGQSEEGRLWDVLWMLRHTARQGGQEIRYQLYVIMKEKQRRLHSRPCAGRATVVSL